MLKIYLDGLIYTGKISSAVYCRHPLGMTLKKSVYLGIDQSTSQYTAELAGIILALYFIKENPCLYCTIEIFLDNQSAL